MKKVVLLIAGVALFASNVDEINKKLDLLLQKINQLEKKVDKKDAEIEKLKTQLKLQKQEMKKETQNVKTDIQKQMALKSCKRLKVVDFKYKYHDEVIPYYDVSLTLKNTYPKKVTYISGNLYVEDKDGVTIFQDFFKRKVDLPVGGEVTFSHTHQLNSEIEKYLKDENPQNLKIYFTPIQVEFADGTLTQCN